MQQKTMSRANFEMIGSSWQRRQIAAFEVRHRPRVVVPKHMAQQHEVQVAVHELPVGVDFRQRIFKPAQTVAPMPPKVDFLLQHLVAQETIIPAVSIEAIGRADYAQNDLRVMIARAHERAISATETLL